MPYITVGKENSGNIDLYYEDHGSGRPVILIHGWPLSGDSWEKQMPVLIEEGYRVITYDRRGFGRSSRPVTGYTYDTFADDLHRVITTLNLNNATLVGFSMGGGEVARYLGTYGSRNVAQAAFISAIPPFLLKTADNPQGLDLSVFDGIRKAIVDDRPEFLSRFFHDFYNADIFLGKKVSEQALRLSWTVAAGASAKGTLDCVTAWETDFRHDLPLIHIPTLVIHGTADRIVPFGASGRRIHEMVDGSRFIAMEGAPHGLNWTHAAELNRTLLEFLGSYSPAQKAMKAPVRATGR